MHAGETGLDRNDYFQRRWEAKLVLEANDGVS